MTSPLNVTHGTRAAIPELTPVAAAEPARLRSRTKSSLDFTTAALPDAASQARQLLQASSVAPSPIKLYFKPRLKLESFLREPLCACLWRQKIALKERGKPVDRSQLLNSARTNIADLSRGNLGMRLRSKEFNSLSSCQGQGADADRLGRRLPCLEYP
jgi:hypothetical protein